jgi:hypothetical protein
MFFGLLLLRAVANGGRGAAALPIIANNHSLFKIMQTFII